MNKKDRKAFEERLLTAIKKVIQDNNADLTNKIEKAIKKSIKKIAKKSFELKDNISEKELKKDAQFKKLKLK